MRLSALIGGRAGLQARAAVQKVHGLQPLVAMSGTLMRWVLVSSDQSRNKRGRPFGRPLSLGWGSLLLLLAAVVGLDFCADGSQHLFHIVGMCAVGLEFEVFVQGFSGSRRGFQLALLVCLAVAHQH